MKNYNSFEFLKKIYFERTSGSENELKAANLIKEEIEARGGKANLEGFEVEDSTISKAKVAFKGFRNVKCVGVGLSGSTDKNGVTGELVYINSLEKAKLTDVKGKICLVHGKLINYKIYKELCKKGPLALIETCGNIYEPDSDIDPYQLRPRHTDNGKIPTVAISIIDAEEILKNQIKEASVTLIQKEHPSTSHNVVAKIKGKIDEVITFTAHYDSVIFSKGAYDNATGVIALLELYSYFKAHKPYRTLEFIFCGSEERGLLGSKDYVKVHKDELEKHVFNINVDMVATTLGNDIAVCSAEMGLVNYLKYESTIQGFALTVSQGVYSSDSTPFADNGVPSMSFARISPPGGPTIHTHKDIIDHLEPINYYETMEFIIHFSDIMVNSKTFPVNKVIPDNIKEELDYYMARKERPEK